MKTQKTIGLLSLFLISLFTACSSDSNENSVANSSVSATIDGQSWQSIQNGVSAILTSVDDEGITKNVLQLIAVKEDQSILTLQFPINNLTEGTYSFQGDGAGMLNYTDFGTLSLFSSSAPAGTFVITISDVNLTENTLSGTFSGTLFDAMQSGISKEITNGVFTNVQFESAGIYSNGSMSVAKNNGTVFTMSDESSTDSKIIIAESSIDNSITVTGYALATDANFGIYSVQLPKNTTPGTYDITSEGLYQAAYAGNEAEDFAVLAGSITIVSHVGNTIKATFNYTATKGAVTVTVSQGAFEITHLN